MGLIDSILISNSAQSENSSLDQIRNNLIEKGVNLPQTTIDRKDYDISDQFETFSRHDGHCNSSVMLRRIDWTTSIHSKHEVFGAEALDDQTISGPSKSLLTTGEQLDHIPLDDQTIAESDRNHQLILEKDEPIDYGAIDTEPSFQEGIITTP